ncbi:MAG: site-specific integrase [Chitinophagales bacterium]
MPTTKVYFKQDAALKDGSHSVFLRVTHERQVKYIKIGTSLKKDWDFNKDLPKKSHPLQRELIALIRKKEHEAAKLFINHVENEKDFTVEQLRAQLKNSTKKTSVYSYFEKVKEKLQKEGRLNYRDIFNSTYKNLYKFREGKDFYFGDITQTFISDFVAFLKEQNVKDNSIFVYLRTFKTLINYARTEHLVKEGFNPFKEISFAKYRKIKTAKRAIRNDRTQEIEQLSLEMETRLWHSRNYFLFSYYTMGTNFTDLAHLTWEQIGKDVMSYTRQKTKREYSIPLNSKAKEILSYYRKNNRDKYVFPILSEELHVLPSQKFHRVKRVLKELNADLKTIGGKLGMEDHLTSYVARHTAATTLKRAGQPVQVIKELMGHDSERTTEIYLEQLDESFLEGAVSVL